MKPTLRILLCLTLLPLLLGCTGHRRYAALLDEAEQANRVGRSLPSENQMLEVARHYDRWWIPRKQRIRSRYLLGCVYRDLNNTPRALDNYQQAVALGNGSKNVEVLGYLMRTHSQMAGIFEKQRLLDKEETELLLAKETSLLIQDTLSTLIFRELLCNLLYNKEQYKECIEGSRQLYESFLQSGFRDEGVLSLYLCIKSYMQLEEYGLAKRYLDLYESCSYFSDNPNKVKGGLGALYILKGRYYLGIEKNDSAEFYFRKGLLYGNLGNNELLAYKGLYKTFAMSNVADSVLKYTLLYSDAKERSYNEGVAEATIQAKELYDYTIEQREAKKKEREASWLKMGILAVSMVSILTALSLLYSYYVCKG